MIKRSGIYVLPSEAEDVLQSDPDIARVGVTGVGDAVRGENIKPVRLGRIKGHGE